MTSEWEKPIPGEWHAWTYGVRIRGWTLKCGNLEADIRTSSGEPPYWMTINNHQFAHSNDLEELQRMAEEHIVKRIAVVLPAYRLIRQRMLVRARSICR